MLPIRSTVAGRTRAARCLATVLTEVELAAAEQLGEAEGDAFIARIEQVWLDFYEAMEMLYGPERGDADLDQLASDLLKLALQTAKERRPELRALDRRREIDAQWFQRARMIGYVAYTDRFATSLVGVRKRLDYLAELGVTYLHLMPLLKPRDGENDGGYAVADYRSIDPRLGTMADLEELATDLHGRGMSLCVDFVLNHTADTHEWAEGAKAGNETCRDYYLVFPDRRLPDAYERTLPEVFPDMAPGSFTWVPEMDAWVWTTFYQYQWDLNWANPDVFRVMLDTLLSLVNRGVDVVRLDAVPFTWKRMGTNCQNQPEAHVLLQMLRALVRVAAPGVVFKAEAIVAPEELVQYLGAHDRYRPECDLAYHNQLMVRLWSSLAARDGQLATAALSRLRQPPAPSDWVTYVRNHDDIGWAIADEDARAVGWDGFAHQQFLRNYFHGTFPGSWARGVPFQENPATGDARTSGTTASLCGIDVDPWLAVRRLLLLYSVIYSYGGIPLIYMGDEIALHNDEAWADDPEHEDDNRWLHRPVMDWAAAERRHDPNSIEGRAFEGLSALGAARRAQLALRGGGETSLLWTHQPHVLAYRRRNARSGILVVLANFSDDAGAVDVSALTAAGLRAPAVAHASEPHPGVVGGHVPLLPWGFVWLTEP
jgi:amylosucrase